MYNKLILYKDESGKVSVNTRFADELDENLTYKKFLLVRQSRKAAEFKKTKNGDKKV